VSSAIISVEPIYGNGWVSAPDQKARDIPARFDLEASPGEIAMGRIMTSGHEFEGASAKLTPRFVEPTDIFNVEIARNARVIAQGYARRL